MNRTVNYEMELFGYGRIRKTIFIPTCFAWKARDSRLAGEQSQQFRLQLDARQTNHRELVAGPKVPDSYLSICREPIRDPHGSLFPSVRWPLPGFLRLEREGNVGFPGLEGTIRGGAVGRRRGYDQMQV